MFKLFIFAAIFAYTQAQRWSFGNCPDVELQANFTLQPYMGRWYENRRYFAIFEFLQNCVTADYALQDNTVSVLNKGYNRFTEGQSVANGVATQPDPNVPAKLKVRFDGSPVLGDYWVVSTDYTTYSIVWSCTKVPYLPANIQFAWVLTRQPEPEQDKIDEINSILDAKRINKSKFSMTSQTRCPDRPQRG